MQAGTQSMSLCCCQSGEQPEGQHFSFSTKRLGVSFTSFCVGKAQTFNQSWATWHIWQSYNMTFHAHNIWLN